MSYPFLAIFFFFSNAILLIDNENVVDSIRILLYNSYKIEFIKRIFFTVKKKKIETYIRIIIISFLGPETTREDCKLDICI